MTSVIKVDRAKARAGAGQFLKLIMPKARPKKAPKRQVKK